MGYTFISYSRKDREYALKFAQALQQRNIEYWIDSHIEPGDKWPIEVMKAVIGCSSLIVIMTPDAEASSWVMKEYLIAEDHKKIILPLLLKGERFPGLLIYQEFDVRQGILPNDEFFERLAQINNTYISIPSTEATSPNSFETALTLTDVHRKADLRLLNELWFYVNTNRINFVMNSEMRPSSWTVTIRSRKTEKNWEIIEYGTAKKTDIQCGIQV